MTFSNRDAETSSGVSKRDVSRLSRRSLWFLGEGGSRDSKQPRELVKTIAGKHFIELPESDVCCGSAGTYNLTEPAMAERLQARKIENNLKTGAQLVVTSNPGCILQIQAGLRKAGAKVEVLHIADFLDRANG